MSAFIDDFPISTIGMSSSNAPTVVVTSSSSSSAALYRNEVAAIDHINKLLLKSIETDNCSIQKTFIEYIEILHNYYYENENYFLADYIHNNILHKINNSTLETLRGRSSGSGGRDNTSLLHGARSRLRESIVRVSTSISSASTAIAAVSISENQITNHRRRFGLGEDADPSRGGDSGEEEEEEEEGGAAAYVATRSRAQSAAAAATKTIAPNPSLRGRTSSSGSLPTGGLTTFNIRRISEAFSSIGTNAFAYSSSAFTDYEDVVDDAVLQAPIVDVCICQRGDPVPPGYYRIFKSPTNRRANLNAGSGGNHIYLCIKKGGGGTQASSELPIIALVVVLPDRGESVPPGFCLVRRGKHICNLNTGTTSERIFLCYKRDKGNPIVDLQVFFPSRDERCPSRFNVIERTATNLVADLNSGSGGQQILLAYRQVISRLDVLLVAGGGSGEGVDSRLRKRTMSDNASAIMARQQQHASDGQRSQAIHRISISKKDVIFRLSTSLDESFNSTSTGDASEELGQLYQRELMGNDEYYYSNSNVSSSGDLPAARGGLSETLSERSASELGTEDAVSESISERPMNPHRGSNPGVGGAKGGGGAGDVTDNSGAPLAYDVKVMMYLLLLCLYTKDAQMTDISIAALDSLVRDTSFFAGSFAVCPVRAARSTQLDVVIDSLLDRLDFCFEPDHKLVVSSLSLLVRFSSGGGLSLHAIHKIFKYASFLFNYYACKKQWDGSSAGPCNDDGSELHMLALVKELMLILLAQAEKASASLLQGPAGDAASDCSSACSEESTTPSSGAANMVRSLVLEAADEAVDNFELSRVVDCIDALLAKRSSTINSSSSFWSHVNRYSAQLFPLASDSGGHEGGDRHAYAFRQLSATLCGLCKMCYQQIRYDDLGQPTLRDVGSKLLGLDALIEMLSSAGDGVRGGKVVGYLVRRLVLPLVLRSLGGSAGSLADSRVFAKLLRLVSTVWRCWREHARIEFATVTEQLLIKVLAASSNVNIHPSFQLAALQEVVTWFEQPQLLVEMFVNYDMDFSFIYHWNLFQQLVRSVCALARRTGRQQRDGAASAAGPRRRGAATAADVNAQALHEAARVAKALMDTSGHAFLIMRDTDFRRRSLAEGWDDDRQGEGRGCSSSGAKVDAVHSRSEEVLRSALQLLAEQLAEHQPVKKVVAQLVKSGFLLAGPRDIASFLRLYRGALDASALGEYLGLPGTSPAEARFHSQLRYCYVRASSFVDMALEDALRVFLTGCGFRMPGESQIIGRFVEVFSECFYADNAGTASCPFAGIDTVYLLCYGIIMLNTDLHKSTNAKVRKMTREAWVNQFRGTDGGADVDKYCLLRIYDSISSDAITLTVDVAPREGGHGHRRKGSAAADAAIADTQQDSEDRRLARRRSRGMEINCIDRSLDEAAFAKKLTGYFKEAEEALRLFSPLRHAFSLTGVDANISLEIVALMFDCVWPHLYAIVTDLLVKPFQHTRTPSNDEGPNGEGDAASTKRNSLNTRIHDIYSTFNALDILCYAITAALFLGLREPLEALVGVLQQFRAVAGQFSPDQPDQFNAWRARVLGCDSGEEAEVVDTVNMLHKLFSKLKDRIQETVSYELTRSVAARIEKRARVLQSNSFFVRQGDLIKINRNGRPDPYRFFLFSDSLYYCHLSPLSSRYILHGDLRLSSIIVTDMDSDGRDCSFHITNPLKSFVVVAGSPEEKADWLRDVSLTIESCIKRMSIDSSS